jgi:hypothetical protein
MGFMFSINICFLFAYIRMSCMLVFFFFFLIFDVFVNLFRNHAQDNNSIGGGLSYGHYQKDVDVIKLVL